MAPTLTKRQKTLFVSLKVLVLLGSLVFIYFKLKAQPNINEKLFIRLELLWLTQPWFLLVLPIALMPLNWLLEAAKWVVLSSKIETISLARAWSAVLAGLGLAFVTPHALGDYAGRILHSSSYDRGRLLGALLLGRLLQLIATLFFGTWGLMYYFIGEINWLTFIAGLISLILIAALSITLLQMLVLAFGMQTIFGRWVNKYFGLFTEYSWKEIIQVQLLSLIRYIVFATQFYIIFILLDVGLSPALSFAGISWTLLLKSILPSFNFLSDLGIREAATLLFFEGYEYLSAQIVLASLLLWIINLLVPAIIGLFFVFRLKFKAGKA